MDKNSDNDIRTAREIVRACRHFDGFMPHGAANWKGLRRLIRKGLAVFVADGTCQTCKDPHDGPLYKLTADGRALEDLAAVLRGSK